MILTTKNTVFAFDLDDTLYNEIDYLKSAYLAIAKTISETKWLTLYSKMLSLYRNKKDVFDYISEEYHTDKNQLIETYRSHIPNITSFNHVLTLMANIKNLGGKIAVITDGRTLTQKNKLKSLKVEPFIDTLVISESVGTEKPNENNYKIVEAAFPNHRYLYFGDNFKKDFITPNLRGWTTIGLIDNGLNIHNNCAYYLSQPNYPPKHLILGFNEITLN